MTKQRGYYTLEIGGKKRTLHFSMNFWANFTDLLNISLAEIGDVFSDGISIKGLRTLIYSGLLAYDQENKKEIDYDEFDIGNWLEDIETAEIEKIVVAMTESKILGNSLNGGLERNPKDSKKK
ncbi:MAG: hypothetical protein HN624_02910 [Flavobacteriaceae bacterium]|jgi:hypothetical protein|nr:hypothetical protein [Flavobacteriaceae bacterium]